MKRHGPVLHGEAYREHLRAERRERRRRAVVLRGTRLPFGQLDQGRSAAVLAELVGVHRRTIQAWRRYGVPLLRADRAAVLLGGRHPAEVWPEWWEVTAPRVDR